MPITIGALRESAPGETRVSLVPEVVDKFVAAGARVVLEPGAGTRAQFPDSLYKKGEWIAAAGGILSQADVVLTVAPLSLEQIGQLKPGAVVVGFLQAHARRDEVKALRDRKITSFAVELIPRISRAQSMDGLSSQASLAGYKAVLIAANNLEKFMPMLTTAAGTIRPSQALIIGAGVAGLQAIATARRLGGVVSAFDVRPAAREQVLSLGATFVANDLVAAGAETAGGYARAQSEDEATRTRSALANHVKDVDLVVTTAQIPGKPAPRLLTADMVASMRPGAVIVDLAAESGGNCELTLAGETVQSGTTTIIGPLNVPATVPFHASQMFGKNVLALVTHLSTKEGALSIDPTDEITGAMTVVRDGSVVART